jgi:aminobenzoyl-glutamate utilization protein B
MTSNLRLFAALALVSVLSLPTARGQQGKTFVSEYLDQRADSFAETAQAIWDLAEVGYQETESAELLAAHLVDAGFDVTMGVAGMPTAFVAEWGSGAPVIGIMGEYDALPGILQDRSPERSILEGSTAGHACGHHLFGAGSVAAAIGVKAWLEQSGTPGTIRFYGTPAEEGGAGKVYMVRAGLMDDADVMLHWHPGSQNSAAAMSTLSNKSAKFRFYGVSAHAAAAPERARSALDGVEAMNNMVNMMREHVPQETRMHYVITAGGHAPNVTPDFAEVFYYVRNPDPTLVRSIFERVAAAAEGAAMGTGTRVEYEVIHGLYNMLPNEALQASMHANLEAVGGVSYNQEEAAFAATLQTSFENPPPIDSAEQIQPFFVTDEASPGSTDVADVSWMVPTAGMSAATWVPGTSAHSWQAVASGGTSIGNKGMMVAAKTLAMSAVDLFLDADLRDAARAEFLSRRGDDFHYEALLGDRDPPLDYRKPAGR